jgi:predicted Zn-ribbon and HTH transcriptional regulator
MKTRDEDGNWIDWDSPHIDCRECGYHPDPDDPDECPRCAEKLALNQ